MKKYMLFLILTLLIAATACSAASRKNQDMLNLLADSQVTWEAKSEAAAGNYSYSSSFESWVGFGGRTTIHVSNGAVTGRAYESWDEYKQPQPDQAFEEDAGSLDSNRSGAPVKTIDELYATCQEILETKDPADFYLTFKLFDDNVLNICEYSDKRCADDCSEGVRIDQIHFSNQ